VAGINVSCYLQDLFGITETSAVSPAYAARAPTPTADGA
jgi:hypothetical protein